MELDFEKSLTYISKDPGWVNKLLAGAGISLAGFAVFSIPLFAYLFSSSAIIAVLSFLLSFVCSIILYLLCTGYYAQTGSRRINFSNSFLPDWAELGKLLKTGLKYNIGLFIFILPVLIGSVIFLAALAYLIAHKGLLHPAGFLFMTLLGAIVLLLHLLTYVFCPLMMANFFKDLKILSFVNFKEAFAMLKGNVGNYCILILLYLALSIMLQIAFSVLFMTIIGLIFVPVLYFYIYLVSAELTAQFVLCAKEKQQDAPVVEQ